jgi:hypothetical protein
MQKTLKEIQFTKEDRAFCSEYGCSEAYENFIKDLRQEARNWLNSIKDGKITYTLFGKTQTRNLSAYEEGAVKDWIMHFFNLEIEE